MRKIVILCFICCLTFFKGIGQANYDISYLGINISHTIPYLSYNNTLLDNKEIGIMYDYPISLNKHYISLGVSSALTTFRSQLDSLRFDGSPFILNDFNLIVSVPTLYTYKPNNWLYFKTGFNSNIPIKGNTYGLYSNFQKEGIPTYRKFILEAHAGIGSEISIKRFKIRFEAYLNYPFLTNEYLEKGVSMGFFYQFARKNR